MYLYPQEPLKNQAAVSSRTNLVLNNLVQKKLENTSAKKGTITSMFDAIIKRKLSPEKEADNTQDDLKIHRIGNVI